MSAEKLTILKIGGSVITDKNGELAARTEVMNRLAEEIQKAGVTRLISGVTHSNPYQTVDPDRQQASQDCGTSGNVAATLCHAVEAHRFPGHRLFIHGVHPT